MDFYDSISKFYDKIFPPQPMQVEFIKKQSKGSLSDQVILDVGCGTGNLSIALGPIFKRVEAIDLDGEMLELAREKTQVSNVNYLTGSMLDLTEHYVKEAFETVCCFGNTLVHLENSLQILTFVRQAYEVLKPGGKLLIQIINYDRILDQHVDHLATIENEGIRFERNYNYDAETHRVNFHTILSKQGTDIKVENTIPLIPIRPAELNQILSEGGFGQIEIYGNFAMHDFNKDSVPYVLSCVKEG